MSESNSHDVTALFEDLLEAMDDAVESANQSGTMAFENREYDAAKHAADMASELVQIRNEADQLRDKWRNLHRETIPHTPARKSRPTRIVSRNTAKQADTKARVSRSNGKRLPPRIRTPQSSYCKAILGALVEMGGRAEASKVLERVERLLRPELKEVDYEPLPNNPSYIRWRNAAQWARQKMVVDRQLKSNSPRGVWEITERGREQLTKQD